MLNEKLSSLHSRYVRPGNGFVPNFQLFAKNDVNGKNEQGVYNFLKVKDDLRAAVCEVVDFKW